jgi:hypothetical protein
MNILQHISTQTYGDILVTLNPPRLPDPQLTQEIIPYRHPLLTPSAIEAQKRIPSINGKRGLHFIGAWTGYGFHEDGFASGINAGIACGGSVPWKVIATKEIRGKRAERTWGTYIARFFISIIMIWLGFLELLQVLWQLYVATAFKQTRLQVKGKDKEVHIGSLSSNSTSRFFSYKKAFAKRSQT